MPPATEEQTRARLIQAAGEVFSDQGFHNATVREICTRADANIAAVNYHFRDKMGLYVAVLLESILSASPGDVRAMVGECKSPEEALRVFIAHMLRRIKGTGVRGSWQMRIMAHEIAQPTAALDQVVEQVIAPNYSTMRGILSRILGLPPDHDTTRLCAHSIVGQVIHYVGAQPVIARIWPAFELTPERIEQVAGHIADFSLAGIKGLSK